MRIRFYRTRSFNICHMKRLLLFTIWLPVTFITLAVSFIFFSYRHKIHFQDSALKNTIQTIVSNKENYKMYASVPRVLGISSAQIKTNDAIPVIIEKYLKQHNSPMMGTGEALVATARKYDIDPLLLIAIAQCESNLGKKMPANCYNPFGWGIHSAGTLCFESWEEGYENVASGLQENYGSLLHSPEEMMKKYNIVSIENAGGSWARCVSQFLEELQ